MRRRYGLLYFLKAGIFFSDAITTVSEKYADEICKSPESSGLNGLLTTRRKDLSGILMVLITKFGILQQMNTVSEI